MKYIAPNPGATKATVQGSKSDYSSLSENRE